MNKNLDVRDSFGHICRIFFCSFRISYFVFLSSNRRILSPATKSTVTSSKAPLRASALSDYSYPISATKQPTRALPFTNPPVLIPPSVSSSSLHPLRRPQNRRDASTRASFHCGRRAFPATFVRPRQGRYREAKLSLYCKCKIVYSCCLPLSNPRYCLN